MEGNNVTSPAGQAVARAQANATALMVRDAHLIDDMPKSKELTLRGRIALADLDADPDARVSAQTEQDLFDAIPENTKKQARYVWGRWIWWCGKTGRHAGDRQTPANPSSLRDWITDHWVLRKPVASRGEVGPQPYAYSVVRNAVYMVCGIHGLLGHASPARDGRVERQLDVYEKKWKAHAGYKVRKAYALTHEGSVQIARSYNLTTVGGLRNAAAFRMQWDMMARAEEILKLQRRHLRWEVPGKKVTVSILDPKEGGLREVGMQAVLELEVIDADGRRVVVDGQVLRVPHPDADVDPVALLWRWCEALDAAGYTDPRTPVFHDVYSGYPRKDGTLAGKIRETPWTYDIYSQVWAYVIRKLGIDVQFAAVGVTFGTHMNRRGPISAAVRNKIPLEVVRKRSGHSASSPVIHEYYDTGEQWDDQNPAVLIRMAEGRRAQSGG